MQYEVARNYPSSVKSFIYYCPRCGKTFRGTPESRNGVESCPNCGALLVQTTIDVDSWHSFNSKEKNALKDAFARGQYLMRNTTTTVNISDRSSTTSGAEEIRKYKELMEEGVISPAEFETQKKQLLGL